MTAQALGRKTPKDHGVQIRFINDLCDSGGGQPGPQHKPKSQTSSKYGVAVRVQGIDGQPYVVLKDGQKGDQYGVQLKTQYNAGHSSLPRRRDKAQPGGLGIDTAGLVSSGALRRAQSHGSLLNRDGEGVAVDDDCQLSRPPGDGKSGSYGNLYGGIGVRGEREQVHHVGIRHQNPERRIWEGSYEAGLNGSPGSLRDNESYPNLPQKASELHSTYRQTSVNRMVNRFDADQQQRGASPHISPNAYTSPSSSTHSSLGCNQNIIPKDSGHPVNQEAHVTPDLLLDQGQTTEMGSEEEHIMQTIYHVLREGSKESDVIIWHKVKVIFQRIHNRRLKEEPGDWTREKRELERKVSELQNTLQEERRASFNNSDPALKAELESCLDENLQLQEMLEQKKKDLNERQSELTQLRMDRESAETRVRDIEDQLAELQEELRRDSRDKMDLMSLQAQLADVCQLKQKLEETLRQRERELTALKGALKEEVATHDKEIEGLREQYSADMERLRGTMEQVSQSHAGIEAERLRVNASVRSLQQQLEDCRDESSHWMEQFHATREELRTIKQELLQTRLEKEEFEEEVNELKEKMKTMKQSKVEMSETEALIQELQHCSAELQKAKSGVEKQRTEFDKKVMEVISLKKSHQEQEAELNYEVNRLKNQLQRSKDDFAKAQEKNKQLPDPAVVLALEQKLGEACDEVSQFKKKLLSAKEEQDAVNARLSRAQAELKMLEDSQHEQEESNKRLKDKLSRLQAQLQANATESSEAELALHAEVTGLRSELDDAKRKASRLSEEHQQLCLRAEDGEKEKETLKQAVAQMEELKHQQEKALEKLLREHESLTLSTRDEVQTLRVQLEEQRERARKEMQEVQRHGSNTQTELDRSHNNLRRLEEELSRQKKELLLACEERDNHQLDKELIANRLRHIEGEMESSKNSLSEKNREIRILEEKLKRLELELEEERGSTDMMSERLDRNRDQIDQLRSELMQERSSKQDLELDKNAMERHLKELRSRVGDMEGQSRSFAGVSQMESKIQELEESLRSEEREKNSVLASQRRLERKLKELNMMLDEERQAHTEQRDQLSLRVKALKRQVDEGETELERIDALRRKAHRDMEEQMEIKEALQSRVTALETELKRKTQAAMRPVLDSSALSSDDDDDDSIYDSTRIASILTEGNLQASSC